MNRNDYALVSRYSEIDVYRIDWGLGLATLDRVSYPEARPIGLVARPLALDSGQPSKHYIEITDGSCPRELRGDVLRIIENGAQS